MTATAEDAPKMRVPWAAIAWIAVPLAICYAPVLQRLVAQWWNDPDMGHGFFVPAVDQPARRGSHRSAQTHGRRESWRVGDLLSGGHQFRRRQQLPHRHQLAAIHDPAERTFIARAPKQNHAVQKVWVTQAG